MFNSQSHRTLWLAVATAGLFMVAGCSNQPTNQAEATPVAKKRAPAKPASRKAQAVKPANKSEADKPVTAKSATPKPVAVSSKVTPETTLVTVPKGTAISATIRETLASNKNQAGDSFAARLSTPVKVGGKTVIPKGAQLTGRVVKAKEKGPELTVALASVEIGGKSYPLKTNSIGPSGKRQADDSGAAKPAAAGKPEKDITVPAKTQLEFKLAKSVKIPVKG